MTIRFGALLPLGRVNGQNPPCQFIPPWDFTHRAMQDLAKRLNTAPFSPENQTLVSQLQHVAPDYRPGQPVMGVAVRDRMLYRVKQAFLVTGKEVDKARQYLTHDGQQPLDLRLPGKAGLAQPADNPFCKDIYDVVREENQAVRLLKADETTPITRPVQLDFDAELYHPGRTTAIRFMN